jgi:hypothetical protein
MILGAANPYPQKHYILLLISFYFLIGETIFLYLIFRGTPIYRKKFEIKYDFFIKFIIRSIMSFIHLYLAFLFFMLIYFITWGFFMGEMP